MLAARSVQQTTQGATNHRITYGVLGWQHPSHMTQYKSVGGLQVHKAAVLATIIHSRASSSRFPGSSGVRSSPFLIRRFEVGINGGCSVLCIWIFCHHFQLGFNSLYLCTDTGKRKSGREIELDLNMESAYSNPEILLTHEYSVTRGGAGQPPAGRQESAA